MAAAHRGGARGGLRDRTRWLGTALRPAAAGRRSLRPAGCASGADRVLRGDDPDQRVRFAGVLAGPRRRGVRRAAARRRPRAGDAPVPRAVELQAFIAAFWATGKPVGAICHGVLVLARSKDAERGQRARGPHHDLPAEVHGARRLPAHCVEARPLLPDLSGVRRGRGDREPRQPGAVRTRPPRDDARNPDRPRPAFVVEDGNYVSARWPGDAYLFAERFISRLNP